jgi:hypothetical protein
MHIHCMYTRPIHTSFLMSTRMTVLNLEASINHQSDKCCNKVHLNITINIVCVCVYARPYVWIPHLDLAIIRFQLTDVRSACDLKTLTTSHRGETQRVKWVPQIIQWLYIIYQIAWHTFCPSHTHPTLLAFLQILFVSRVWVTVTPFQIRSFISNLFYESPYRPMSTSMVSSLPWKFAAGHGMTWPYETRTFITAFTKARHCTLSWANLMELFTHPHQFPIFS